MSGDLLEIAAANRRGARAGLYSICSANRFVIEAGARRARDDGTLLCVESTCNQVNQGGGYTGMTPADFRRFVEGIAAVTGLERERVVLGGDHLGPYPWRGQPAAVALDEARTLVRDCVVAGYVKIHLDTSMACADDGEAGAGGAPGDEVVAGRAADLAAVAESAWGGLPAGSPPPVYVIGTEVPAPGGETAAGAADPSSADASADPVVTSPAAAARTLALHEAAFRARGLEAAWERVMALVVQPGVEFGDHTVTAYRRAEAAGLVAWIETQAPSLVFEAHSTDYQSPAALCELVDDHFAVLKVGPALTYAFREAVFALAAIEEELSGAAGTGRAGPEVAPSCLRETVERAMLEHPEHWRPYYRGDDDELRRARVSSYSDRIRYYWSRPEVEAALGRLLRNLAERPIPMELLSRHLPEEAVAVEEGSLAGHPRDVLGHHIGLVVDTYARAAGAAGR